MRNVWCIKNLYFIVCFNMILNKTELTKIIIITLLKNNRHNKFTISHFKLKITCNLTLRSYYIKFLIK